MSEFNSCLRSGKVAFGDDLCSVSEVTHLNARVAVYGERDDKPACPCRRMFSRRRRCPSCSSPQGFWTWLRASPALTQVVWISLWGDERRNWETRRDAGGNSLPRPVHRQACEEAEVLATEAQEISYC